MGGKKKTKQDEISELQLKVAALTKELHEANFRKATIAEEKQKLAEQVEYLEKKYEDTFLKLMMSRHDLSSLQAAVGHWYKHAMDSQKEILRRGARRSKHDPEFAIIRELIHLDGLDADQVIAMAKQHPEADLRRMVSVAGEFGLRLKFDIVSKELKKADRSQGLADEIEADLFTFNNKDGKWKAEVKTTINDIFALDPEKANGDSKD